MVGVVIGVLAMLFIWAYLDISLVLIAALILFPLVSRIRTVPRPTRLVERWPCSSLALGVLNYPILALAADRMEHLSLHAHIISDDTSALIVVSMLGLYPIFASFVALRRVRGN